MLAGAQAVELSKRYQWRLLGLAGRVEVATSRIWDELGSWDENDIERFAAAAAPVVAGAQTQGASLAVGYLQLLTGAPHSVDVATLTGGVDFTEPFVAYWAALGRGDAWDEALSSGSTRAGTISIDGVHSAARGASDQIDKVEKRITKWQRAVSGLACEWCLTVAQATYRTAESASFGHNRCDCVPIPII